MFALFLWGSFTRIGSDYRQPAMLFPFILLLSADRLATLFTFLANMSILLFWDECNGNFTRHQRQSKLAGLNHEQGDLHIGNLDQGTSKAAKRRESFTNARVWFKLILFWLLFFELALLLYTWKSDFRWVRVTSGPLSHGRPSAYLSYALTQLH